MQKEVTAEVFRTIEFMTIALRMTIQTKIDLSYHQTKYPTELQTQVIRYNHICAGFGLLLFRKVNSTAGGSNHS